jgi:hypothetical protein
MRRTAAAIIVLTLLVRGARAEHEEDARVTGIALGTPAVILGVTSIVGNSVVIASTRSSRGWATFGMVAGGANVAMGIWSLLVRGCKANSETDCTERGDPFNDGAWSLLPVTWLALGSTSALLAGWNFKLGDQPLALVPATSGLALAGRW